MNVMASSTALTVLPQDGPDLWEGYIVGVWQEPFTLGMHSIKVWAPGMTIADIVVANTDLPTDFQRVGVVVVGEWEIPRDKWHCIKPKPFHEDAPIVIRFLMPVYGGGGDSKKKGVFSIIATLGLAVLTAGASAGWFATAGGLFAAGSTSARILSAGISLLGSLVIGALSAPPTPSRRRDDSGATQRGAAAISGNVLEADASIACVIGTRWIFPPFAVEPYIEYSVKDEIVHAVYVLAGPHEIQTIKLGDAVVATSTDSDVTIEVRRGLPDDIDLALTEIQTRTTDLSTQMSVHQVSEDSQTTLVGTDATNLPSWHAFAPKRRVDEIRLQMVSSGLITDDDRTADLLVPFRIRFRERGTTTWKYFPEFFYQNNSQSENLLQVRIFFQEGDAGVQSPQSFGFVYAYKSTPGQTATPASATFNADAYFSAGAGNDLLSSGTVGTSNVRNVLMLGNEIRFYLDPNVWTADFYDFEIIRGMALKLGSWSASAYTYSGSIWDLFGYRGSGTIAFTRKNLLDNMTIKRVTSVWNQKPLDQNDLTVISLTARNKSIEKMQVKASGYVYDWLGYKEPSATPTQTIVAANTIAAIATTQDYCLSATITLPLVPVTGYLWYSDGSGYGASCYVDTTEGYFIVRAGANSQANTSSTAVVLKIPLASMPFDAKPHKMAWSIETNPIIVKFFCDNQLIMEDQQTGTAAATAIAGSGGKYLHTSTTGIPGFSGAISGIAGAVGTDLKIWAGGQVLDESEAAWNNLTTTSNPAPNFHHVLTSVLAAKNVPNYAIDDEILLAWRWHCILNDYTVDMVVENENVWDLLTTIASCGYARPTRSEKFGVFMDYDRSDEAPVQIFTPIQSSDFSWTKAFAQLPTGLRLTYADETNENNDQQVIVRDPAQIGRGDQLESSTYEGFVNEKKTIKRGLFDLMQGRLRSTFYDLKVPSNWLRCKRGSLVAVSYYTLSQYLNYALIESVVEVSGDVTQIVLDTEVNFTSTPFVHDVVDVYAVTPDVYGLGRRFAATIQHTDGSSSTYLLDDSGGLTNTLTFETPAPATSWTGSAWDGGSVKLIAKGCMVIIGPATEIYRRLIVSDLVPADDLTATVTMVDEAPKLWQTQL